MLRFVKGKLYFLVCNNKLVSLIYPTEDVDDQENKVRFMCFHLAEQLASNVVLPCFYSIPSPAGSFMSPLNQKRVDFKEATDKDLSDFFNLWDGRKFNIQTYFLEQVLKDNTLLLEEKVRITRVITSVVSA